MGTEETSQKMRLVQLLVDYDCHVERFGEIICEARGNYPNKFKLLVGSHYLYLTNIYTGEKKRIFVKVEESEEPLVVDIRTNEPTKQQPSQAIEREEVPITNSIERNKPIVDNTRPNITPTKKAPTKDENNSDKNGCFTFILVLIGLIIAGTIISSIATKYHKTDSYIQAYDTAACDTAACDTAAYIAIDSAIVDSAATIDTAYIEMPEENQENEDSEEETDNTEEENEESTQASSSVIRPIDLGLSVLWADRNIGSDQPIDEGHLYGWGNTTNNLNKNLNQFPCKNPPYSIKGTKYDNAHNLLGGRWRMPTIDELCELKDRCQWESLTDREGRNFCKVTGPNGNYIILPLPGYEVNGVRKRRNIGGYIWSADIYEKNHQFAANLAYGKNGVTGISGYFRYGGEIIRAVQDK